MKTVKYQRNPSILFADMNGETVMMELCSAKYYNIGEIGGRVWSLLEKPKTLDELVTELMKDYDVERDRCRADLQPFLDTLKAKELILETAE